MKMSMKPLEWPYPNLNSFEQENLKLRSRMLNYLICGRGSRSARATIAIESLKHQSALRGLASNPEVRIALARAALPKVLDVFTGDAKNDLYLVTIAPKAFVWSKPPGIEPDLSALKKLIQSCLGDFDYLAAAEPALYDNWWFRPWVSGPKYFVSWHVHAIVSAHNRRNLAEQIGRMIGGNDESLVPGWPAVHIKPIDVRTVEQRLLYILKLPRTSMRVFEGKPSAREEVSPTKYHQRKRPIAPKELEMLLTLLSRYTIGTLVFGGGIGCELKREAFRDARAILGRNEIV